MLSFRKVDHLAYQLKKHLELMPINQLAKTTRFVKRSPKKICPLNFLLAFFIMVLTGGQSLSTFAITIGLIGNFCLSKQAVHKRINESLLDFLKSILEKSLSKTITLQECFNSRLSKLFNRILIQDSTNISVSPKLKKYFPGNKNQSGKPSAILKIQVVYDLLKESFYCFDISGFTKNDQRASIDILNIISKGDLIIRDLGYLVLSVLKNISIKGAFFISRFKYGTYIFEKNGVSSFNLLHQLRRYGSLDVEVVLGAQEKVPVRLVAIPVPEHVSAERRRRAKSDRDKRLNRSKEYLALLNWNIFILNVPNDILTIDQIAKLYRLRWRIEIIIKSWKSHFHLSKIPNASVIRVYSFIYAMLIFLTLFQTCVFRELYQRMKDKQKNQLSLFSVSRFYKEQIWAIISYCYEPERIINQIHYHCKYESRSKRINHVQLILALG
jgi:hypothetical protein